MVTTIATGLIIFIAGLVLFFVARWMLRLALKAAFVFALVFVLFGGAAAAWWQGWFSSSTSARPPATPTNQRPNTNRRANQK